MDRWMKREGVAGMVWVQVRVRIRGTGYGGGTGGGTAGVRYGCGCGNPTNPLRQTIQFRYRVSRRLGGRGSLHVIITIYTSRFYGRRLYFASPPSSTPLLATQPQPILCPTANSQRRTPNPAIPYHPAPRPSLNIFSSTRVRLGLERNSPSFCIVLLQISALTHQRDSTGRDRITTSDAPGSNLL